jgi:hypothetical protein
MSYSRRDSVQEAVIVHLPLGSTCPCWKAFFTKATVESKQKSQHQSKASELHLDRAQNIER